MSLARVSLWLLCASLILPACSNHAVLPSNPVQSAFAAAKKTFGVGFSTQAVLMYDATPHTHDYCQTKGHSFDSCPSYANGKKSESHSASGSGKDQSTGAKTSYAQSGTSALGHQEYAQKVTVSSSKSPLTSASGQEHFGWVDVLHIKSSSLAQLTPVTVWFQLAVKPSKTSVNCKYDPTAYVSFEATGTDKNQSILDVTGKCVNGKFVYTLDNGNGPKGLVDVGYENTSVGANLSISGTGTLRLAACELATSCPKNYSSEAAGTVTWRVKKITPKGVTVSSDSGTRYTK